MWNKLDRPVICPFCHDRHLKLLFPGFDKRSAFRVPPPDAMRFSNPAFIKYIETSGNEYLITPQAENLFKGNQGQVWSRGKGNSLVLVKLKAHFVNALKNIDRQQTIHSTQTPQQQSLPTLINLATRSQPWTLFRWNYNTPSAWHDLRQEKLTS